MKENKGISIKIRLENEVANIFQYYNSPKTNAVLPQSSWTDLVCDKFVDNSYVILKETKANVPKSVR